MPELRLPFFASAEILRGKNLGIRPVRKQITYFPGKHQIDVRVADEHPDGTPVLCMCDCAHIHLLRFTRFKSWLRYSSKSLRSTALYGVTISGISFGPTLS